MVQLTGVNKVRHLLFYYLVLSSYLFENDFYRH